MKMPSKSKVDDSTCCPECYKGYTENGSHLPRILPCHCTICDKCIKKLLKDNKITCPQDRKTHQAANGVKSFLENKYILKNLKQNGSSGQKGQQEVPDFRMCKTHGRDMNLYCKNKRCHGEICSLCMIESHKSHTVVDLVSVREGVRANLITEIQAITDDLMFCQEKLKIARIRIDEHYVQTIEGIYNARMGFVNEINTKITNIENDLSKLKIPNDDATYMEMSILMEDAKKANIRLQDELKKEIVYKYYKVREEESKLNVSKQLYSQNLRKKVKSGKITIVKE